MNNITILNKKSNNNNNNNNNNSNSKSNKNTMSFDKLSGQSIHRDLTVRRKCMMRALGTTTFQSCFLMLINLIKNNKDVFNQRNLHS